MGNFQHALFSEVVNLTKCDILQIQVLSLVLFAGTKMH